LNPAVLVFSFIPDNLRRSELSVFHGSPKPFFNVADGRLVLKNTPVPLYEPSAKHIGWFRKVFGYSYLIHRIAMRFGFAERWLVEIGELREEHTMGGTVGCLIMQELRRIQDDKNIGVVILPVYGSSDMDMRTYPDSIRKHNKTIGCARRLGLPVADTFPVLKAKFGKNNEDREEALRTYWRYPEDPHFSAKGYRLSAELVAPYVRKLLDEKGR
jgi:hypothetical protein